MLLSFSPTLFSQPNSSPLTFAASACTEMLGGKSMPIVGQKGVKYGLQAPAAAKKAQKTKGMFAGSDDEADTDVNDLNAAVRAQQGVKRSDAKINKAHAAALQEEPNCFDYDSFYDTIQESRKEAELASFQQEQGGPRYLTAMISARDRRHRIQDMAYNRREALAAQAEDGLYEGKEKFATVAYKKKLEEDRLFAEHLAAQDKADEELTVDRMGMDGFIGVIQSALAAPTDHDSAEERAGGKTIASQCPTEAMDAQLQKRAELALQKRLDAMDKGDLKRYHLERQLKGFAGAQTDKRPSSMGSNVPGKQSGLVTTGDEGEGSGAGLHKGAVRGVGSGAREKRRADSPGSEGVKSDVVSEGSAALRAARKLAGEDKIAAARERAKQRKLMRS